MYAPIAGPSEGIVIELEVIVDNCCSIRCRRRSSSDSPLCECVHVFTRQEEFIEVMGERWTQVFIPRGRGRFWVLVPVQFVVIGVYENSPVDFKESRFP